jgi:hypothetical protein
MKFLKVIGNKIQKAKMDLSDLNQKVKWTWRYGTNKKNYVIEYTSQEISSSVVQRMFGYLLKGKEIDGLTYASLIPDEWVELPKSHWVDYEDKLIGMFPKTIIKSKPFFLSKRLETLSVFKTEKGLKIRGEVKGLIK